MGRVYRDSDNNIINCSDYFHLLSYSADQGGENTDEDNKINIIAGSGTQDNFNFDLNVLKNTDELTTSSYRYLKKISTTGKSTR